MERIAITRDDSATIRFVVACLLAGAIDKSELRAWADHVLINDAECPLYIVNLGSFNEALQHVYKVIGFVPGSQLTKSEEVALRGIALTRGRETLGTQRAEMRALKALAENPQVAERFRATFPFLTLLSLDEPADGAS